MQDRSALADGRTSVQYTPRPQHLAYLVTVQKRPGPNPSSGLQAAGIRRHGEYDAVHTMPRSVRREVACPLDATTIFTGASGSQALMVLSTIAPPKFCSATIRSAFQP